MDTAWDPNRKPLESKRIEQLSVPLREVELSEEGCEIVNEIAEVSISVQQRIEVIQEVIAVRGTERYGKVQVQAAKKLGLSVRSLRRLMRSWQQHGIAGLRRRSRSDEGRSKQSQEWQEFIVKT